jgi:putative membrane protein
MRTTIASPMALAFAMVLAVASSNVNPVRAAIGRENFLSDDEQRFVDRMWKLNAMEIALTSSMEQQSARADVKVFGERMLAYHADLNDSLKETAEHFSGSVPRQLDEAARRIVDGMSGLNGAEFDKQFMAQSIEILNQLIILCEVQSKEVALTPLDKWAGNALPKLRHQLEYAERVGRAAGLPSKAKADSEATTAGHKESGTSHGR